VYRKTAGQHEYTPSAACDSSADEREEPRAPVSGSQILWVSSAIVHACPVTTTLARYMSCRYNIYWRCTCVMLCTQDADDPHNIVDEKTYRDDDKENDDDIHNDAMETEKEMKQDIESENDSQVDHAYQSFKVCTVARSAFEVL
jgi:hypothetical protein